MMLRVTAVAVLTILAAAVPLQAQTTHAVDIVGLAFDPPTITIQQGDIIEWTNLTPLVHTSTSGTNCTADGIWNSGNMFPNAQFQFQFNTAGTYPYFCIPHCLCCAMVGTVTVLPPPAECRLNCPQLDGGVIATGAGPSDKSPDLNNDSAVDLIDISLFAQAFPPNPYDFCADYDCDGLVGLVDLAVFAMHVFHSGPQPGVCN